MNNALSSRLDELIDQGQRLLQAGELAQAESMFLQVLQLEHRNVDALHLLGVIAHRSGRLDEAVDLISRAIAENPSVASFYLNLGNVFKDQGSLDQAAACYQSAIQLNPNYARAYNNLGVVLRDQMKLDQALAYLQNAVRIDPSYTSAHWNQASTLLLAGDYLRGWHEYEWRWIASESLSRRREFPQPWWQGENLSGKTILVWAEQGVGDEILFSSMLPDIIACAGHCVVECDPRLVSLFARSFPSAEVVPRSDPPHPRTVQPDVQFQVPIGNLGRWFRNTLESFPTHHGYLVADPQQVANWRDRLTGLGVGKKVGICWRSMLRNLARNAYYTELDQWKPILTTPGVVFVNLQYDDCQAELEAAEQQFGVKIHAWSDIDLKNDLDGAAALTAALDLVITTATSVAAMAGALGVPTWELFCNQDAWTTLGTDHLPFHPSIRLFPRGWNEGWSGVIQAISVELKKWARA